MGNIFNRDFVEFIETLNHAKVRYILVGGYSVLNSSKIHSETMLVISLAIYFLFETLLFFLTILSWKKRDAQRKWAQLGGVFLLIGILEVANVESPNTWLYHFLNN